MNTPTFVYVDQTPAVLASGRPLADGDVAALVELELDEHGPDVELLSAGRLVEQPAAPTPPAKPRRAPRKPKETTR